MYRSLRIDYPSSLPDVLRQTPTEFEQLARLAMAIKLFEWHRNSSGQAAQLARIPRTTFLMRLADSSDGMINIPAEELAEDVRNAGPAWYRHRFWRSWPQHTWTSCASYLEESSFLRKSSRRSKLDG